jgi:hypothetical protein
MFYAPEHIFDGTEGARFSFHVLRSRTHFWRYSRVQVSCFALSDSFSAAVRASGLVFMFYAPELIFNDIEGAECSFHILRSQTHFRRYRGRRVQFLSFTLPNPFSTQGVRSTFHVLRSRTHFRRRRGLQVPFSFFALPTTLSAVQWASGPALRSQTHFG